MRDLLLKKQVNTLITMAVTSIFFNQVNSRQNTEMIGKKEPATSEIIAEPIRTFFKVF